MVLTTLVVFGLLLVQKYYSAWLLQSLSQPTLTTLIILIQAFLIWWTLDFDLQIHEFVFFLIPSSLFTFVSFVVLSNLGNTVGSLTLVALLVASFYILLAALNIINVSTIRPVPLRRAALSSLFFIGMLMSFLLGWVVLDSDWNQGQLWFSGTLAVFGSSFLFLAADDGRMHWLEMGVLGWILAQFVVLINFWPASPLIAAVALTGWIFVLLGVLHHHINKNLRSSLRREYLIMSILLLGVFLWV